MFWIRAKRRRFDFRFSISQNRVSENFLSCFEAKKNLILQGKCVVAFNWHVTDTLRFYCYERELALWFRSERARKNWQSACELGNISFAIICFVRFALRAEVLEAILSQFLQLARQYLWWQKHCVLHGIRSTDTLVDTLRYLFLFLWDTHRITDNSLL